MSSFELDPRPRLRGKLHAWAFPGAVALAVALIWSAPNGVETVAAAGHFPHLEQPKAVAERIVAFITT